MMIIINCYNFWFQAQEVVFQVQFQVYFKPAELWKFL